MKTALIIGASRGIGMEFVRQYRADGWRVFATARNEDGLAALRELDAEALKLDVTRVESLSGLSWQLDGVELDVAVYNAGVNSERTTGLAPITKDEFDRVFHTNVLGAMQVAPLVLPFVEAAGGSFGFLSSRMGSVELMESNGSWLYRASKAAVNSVVKAVSLEARRATCVAMHPGWVRTDMGGENADIDVETSVAGMRRVLARAPGERATHNGGFYNYDGTPFPW
ncbi:SDR family oxidoreductase [Pandoraea sputorum]|uniref:C signal n=1 Tax=Pandoraea sputorum TaxID=93222 RepID=A0A239S7F8_9BURK|nr:SDR family oxidoreductase [Pandoraea sputorum]AJC15774.1 short chain dehydrogenase [Pandoraea sputorum]SNU81361.1 C signal [Pandoraea sputorum]VVD67760.1 short-chain dehydrogenase [Pandoraea sputorum]